MLWIPFHRYLSTEPLLQPFGLELVCFNPKLVTKFKDGLALRSPKNDERDAFDVAARLRFAELPVSYVVNIRPLVCHLCSAIVYRPFAVILYHQFLPTMYQQCAAKMYHPSRLSDGKPAA